MYHTMLLLQEALWHIALAAWLHIAHLLQVPTQELELSFSSDSEHAKQSDEASVASPMPQLSVPTRHS
jgi:hypothetical protein